MYFVNAAKVTLMTTEIDLTPFCNQENCVVARKPSYSTNLHWTPVFDKRGNPLNQNPNKTTVPCECKTCGLLWNEITQDGKTKIEGLV